MPPWTGIDYTYCVRGPAPFTSDAVFCDQPIIHFWQLSLYLAILFWGLLTVAHLAPLFHNGTHEQAIAGEVLRRLLLQMSLLILVACSFYLLQVLNQGESYLIDALANTDSRPGWYQNCVDCLWTGAVQGMIQDVHGRVQSQGSLFDTLSGGQFTFAPTDSPDAGLFGQSWGQIIGGIATFASTFTTLGPVVRYVVMVLTLGSAPFAVMAAGHRVTRPLFSLWLHLWGELVILALLSALVVAGWSAIIASGSPDDAQTEAYIGLAALGILGGMNLAYLMRIMGQFIQTTSGFYQANYQRLASSILTTAKLGAAVVGTVAGMAVAAGGVEAAGGAEAAAGPGSGSTGPTGGNPPGRSGLAALPSPGSLDGAGGSTTAGGDAWQEWSPATTGNTTGGSSLAANTPSNGSAPGRQGTPAQQAQRALPAAPTGRLRGIATVLAHSRLPVISEAAGPLAAGLRHTHQTEQEQQADWRYAVGQAEATRRELKTDWRYLEGKAERAQARAESDQRHAASAAYSLWRQKEAATRETERKTEQAEQKAESDRRYAASSAYALWRQKEAAMRETARKAESDQRYEARARANNGTSSAGPHH